MAPMKKSMADLDVERRRLEAFIEESNLSDEESDRLGCRLDNIDRAIAAMPARNNAELLIKVKRLAALICPSRRPIVEDCLEHVLLAAVLRDAQALAECAPNSA